MWQALDKNVSSKFLPSGLQQKLKYNYISRSILTFGNHYRNNFLHFFTHPQLPATHNTLPCTSLLERNVVCSALIKLRMKSKFNSKVRLKSETQLSILQFA